MKCKNNDIENAIQKPGILSNTQSKDDYHKGGLNDSKTTSNQQIKTVQSSQSFENEIIPTETYCNKQYTLPQVYHFSELEKRSSQEIVKQSLAEKLNNDKSCISELVNKHSHEKINFRISWTPLNQLLCCCFIGHVGVSNTQGVVYDFKNNFFIGADEGENELRLFGRPTKDLYLELDSEEQAQKLQDILKHKLQIYTSKEAVVGQYKLLKNNCHHFVADVLNALKYKEKQNYTALWVWRQTLLRAKYRNCKGFIKTWTTPIILLVLGLIVLIVFLIDKYTSISIFS